MVVKPKQMQVGEWCAKLLPAVAYRAQFVASNATIGFAFDAQTGVHAYASDRILPFRAKPDSLAFLPKGCDVLSESAHGGEYLCLSTSASLFECGSRETWFNNITDPNAVHSAYVVRQLMLCPEYSDSMIFDHHSSIIARVVSKQLMEQPGLTSNSGSMTEARLKLVDELIDAHLAEDLTISLLAKSVGISSAYFSRAFRKSTGKTPFDYVITRRVNTARQMLKHSNLDISTIAIACGFSSHAHMTSTFRKRIGLSPSQLR